MSDSQRHELDYREADAERGRPAGVLVLAILCTLLAAGAGCFAAVVPIAAFVPQAQNTGNSAAYMAMAGVVYLVFAAGFAWLAFGGYAYRAWLRKVVLALAWPMLVWSLIYTPVAILGTAATPMPPNAPPAAKTVAIVAVAIVLLLFAVGLPLVTVLYFRRRSVIEAFEQRQEEKPSDVARQDTRRIGLWLWTGILVFMLIANLFRPRFAFFGTVLSGAPAAACFVAYGIIVVAAGLLIYRDRKLGVALLAVSGVVAAASWSVTILKLGGQEFALRTGDATQAELMAQSPLTSTPVQLSMAVGGALLALIAILWAGRGVGRSPA